MYLKPLRGTKRFHVKGKLALHFVGMYMIMRRIGTLAYELQLPQELVGVHLVLLVSKLRKCLRLPSEEVLTDACIGS